MKTITPAMQALFNQRRWYTAKLFTFTLADGTVLHYCSGDQDLTVGGITYACGGTTGPYFEKADKRAKTHRAIGTSVDKMVFDVIPGSATVEGFAFLVAVRFGLFDGADFAYQRIAMGAPGDASAGAVLMFGGRVAQVDYSNSAAQFTIASYLELLNIELPRNVYQAGCLNTLFDASCTLSAAAFASTGTVAAAGGGASFQIAGAAAGQAAGYFNLGKIQFTSGQNAGVWRAVQSHTSGPATVNVFPPFGSVPQPGDAFAAYPGCDKQLSTCINKFNNRRNFRGFPDTPQVETAL
jgi:uncharacterized phage protein (TIGR02218 family)